MDRASVIAIEEVCKRCHLYTKHCGMLEYPSQCVHSGHFIDGYRSAEKDLAPTWEDMKLICEIEDRYWNEEWDKNTPKTTQEYYEEVLRRFNAQRK